MSSFFHNTRTKTHLNTVLTTRIFFKSSKVQKLKNSFLHGQPHAKTRVGMPLPIEVEVLQHRRKAHNPPTLTTTPQCELQCVLQYVLHCVLQDMLQCILASTNH